MNHFIFNLACHSKSFELEAWTMHRSTIYFVLKTKHCFKKNGSNNDQTPDYLVIEALISYQEPILLKAYGIK